MRKAVVHLMVAQRHDVGRQQVHDLDGGDALKLAVDQRAAEHIAGNRIDDVFLLVANLIHITRQTRNAADQLFIHLLRQKIAVQIVGM